VTNLFAKVNTLGHFLVPKVFDLKGGKVKNIKFMNCIDYKPTIFPVVLDINECSGSNNCHANANCTDTEGSYTCACHTGYSGDGTSCTSKNVV
jgi:hypothetical protein